MLTDTEQEEEMKKVSKSRHPRSPSRGHRVNRSPSSKNSQSPSRKHRSATKKRTNSRRLTKEEVKYQQFVTGLRRDM